MQAEETSSPDPGESVEQIEGLEPTMKVGCRGFSGQSLWRSLGLLGTEEVLRRSGA